MDIMGTGIMYPTGELLLEPRDEQSVAEDLRKALPKYDEEIVERRGSINTAATFRGDIEREVEDVGDPVGAGWTFLINGNDPSAGEIREVLRPLAERRGMEDPGAPLIFNGEPPDEWDGWLQDNYWALELDKKKVPHYVLLVGGADQIPFLFQSLMDSAACVGRLNFDTVDDLEKYVTKLIRLEDAADPVVSREAVVFAPDADEVTSVSREYMAEPIEAHVKEKFGLATRHLLGDDATKDNLADLLGRVKPALVYTAGHGVAVPYESPLDEQMVINGALVCQRPTGTPLTLDDLFGALDLPDDKPFLEGSVFFQFACFGYGTLAESDYTHWYPENPHLKKVAKADFVAALPKKLLLNPRGPIAYIGHTDTALLLGFADPRDPQLVERWSNRMAPYVHAVNQLLKTQPVGLALERMNKRYDIASNRLASAIDRDRRGKIEWTPEFCERFSEAFLFRNEAQNYLLFADPGARLRIPDK